MKKLLSFLAAGLPKSSLLPTKLGAISIGIFIAFSSFYFSEHSRQAISRANAAKQLNSSVSSGASEVNSTYALKASDSNSSRELPAAALSEEKSAPAQAVLPVEASQNIEAKPEIAAAAPKATSVPAATRGGSAPVSNKVELLDWWKEGQYAFPIGSTAVVRDFYTGRTFNIKRTMGTNHADCEALTLQDTNIIKSIWGGFTWTVRPVHILINGRVLAASMAAMPHAGIDSAPAFAVVDNRSQGYGRGENLDVVKNNGMDGHFDVHFLNSTRHKDGKIDANHQAAIKIAAGK